MASAELEILEDPTKMMTQDDDEEQKKITDPKLYKSTLCQFYLKGPCKNGETCTYAHGTSELRTPTGGSVADLESSSTDKKVLYKTTLCAKFVTYGDCPFGPGCNFAHGVKELRQALELSSVAKEEEERAKSNPSYKTSLCKNYMMGMYCQFADKCQYAHGRHELREKPAAVPPSQLPEDVKKRLAEKAKNLPGYKTKLCNNYENEGFCQYDEMCHYAHGEEELREETDNEKEQAVIMKVRKNPYYKTIMCKSLPNCQYGENCVYAHTESEVRPLSENMKHGGGGPGFIPMKGGYKSSLCKNFMESGNCKFGTKCNFAHGPMELRGPGGPPPMMGGPPMMGPPPPGGPMKFKGAAPGSIMVHGSDGKIKFKTSMCTVFMEQGYCPRGEFCGFAHSAKQLLEAQANDPKYKTALCDSWKNNGHCERGNNCIYAHGQGDLRPKKPPLTTAYPPQYGGVAPSGPPQASAAMQHANNPRYKTSMCIAFAKNGFCNKMAACQYAHGPQELRTGPGGPPMVPPPSMMSGPMSGGPMGGGPMGGMGGGPMMGGGGPMSAGGNYKTAMCKNVLESGNCPRGDSCHFAHSSAELRAKKPTMGMMMGGAGGMGANGVQSNMYKRKRDVAKTVLCQNYSTYGECQYGDSCTFAHGPEELVTSKKQRI